MKRGTNKKRNGFTLVELLTAMAVVGILLALLIPALSAVQTKAAVIRQKAQFHTIGLGLEAFRNDTGDYPPSAYNTTAYGNYTASQRLAEALVGRDGLGFHPDSRFHANGEDSAGKSLYMNHADFEADYPTQPGKDANLTTRKGPYLELESANAVTPNAIYATPGILAPTKDDSFVLADMFSSVKHRLTGKQIGMPILYYRADKTKVLHDPTVPNNSTYNVYDSTGPMNAGGIATIPAPGSGSFHPLINDYSTFYNATANPNFTNPQRPYRAESFILHSAGHDGLYGTGDDVFNFDSGK